MVHLVRVGTQFEMWKFPKTKAIVKGVVIRNDKEKVKRKKTISQGYLMKKKWKRKGD